MTAFDKLEAAMERANGYDAMSVNYVVMEVLRTFQRPVTEREADALAYRLNETMDNVDASV